MSESLPVAWEDGPDAAPVYAVRTFRVVDGSLQSINGGALATRSGRGLDYWQDGVCIATCKVDPEHRAPVEDCTCGVYAWWTIDKLLEQYGPYASKMVAIIQLGGTWLECDKGVKAGEAQIVAWWVADGDENADLVAAAEAVPEARRLFDRDVMTQIYQPPTIREGE